MKTNNLMYLLILFAFFSCNAQNNNLSKEKNQTIDSLLNELYKNEQFNGTVLVAQNDSIIYKNAFGFSSNSKTKKLKINSVFSLASVSKTFTSTATLLLVERGIISLEDKLSTYFPDFPNGNKITVWNLITHTSGLTNYLEYGGYFRVDGRPGDFQDSVTNAKAYNYLKSIITLRFEPGSRFEYSNSGYLLLALVVEKASGKSFHEFIQEEIFTPLQMNNSYVVSKPNLSIPNRAYGFTENYQPDDDNLLTSGGGGVFSTVKDLYKWHMGLSEGKTISKEILSNAYINPKLNDGSLSQDTKDEWTYGMGWIFRMNTEDSIAWHDGGLNACSAIFYQDFGKDFTIILLSNKGSTHSNHPIYAIKDEIIRILN